MFLSDGTVISISLQVEFTESLTMMSVFFPVIVLSVLTGMSHMMVMLLSLLCITVSGSCSHHLRLECRSGRNKLSNVRSFITVLSRGLNLLQEK